MADPSVALAVLRRGRRELIALIFGVVITARTECKK